MEQTNVLRSKNEADMHRITYEEQGRMIKIPRPGSLESLQPQKKPKTALELEIENLRNLTSKSG